MADDEIKLADIFYSCCTINEIPSKNCLQSSETSSIGKEKKFAYGPSITVTYSLCGDKKAGESFKKTFISHLTKEFSYDPNFVIHIADENDEFFLSLDLFLSLFFFVLNFNNHPDRNMKICRTHRKDPEITKSIFTYLKFKNYLKKKLGRDTKKYIKQLTPSIEDLAVLRRFLRSGRNDILFKVDGVNSAAYGKIYSWDVADKLIVSDIDGTITKSDLLGHVYDFMGKDWSHCGVAELFTKVEKQKYKFIYLSNRPGSMYERTTNMLKNIVQNDSKMPDGPLFLNPTGLFRSLVSEVRNVSYFYKIEALKQVKECFACKCDPISVEMINKKKMGNFKEILLPKLQCQHCGGNIVSISENNPFFSGFGNKLSDLIAYRSIGIPRNKIFIISSDGQLSEEKNDDMRPFIQRKSNEHSYITLNNFAHTLFPLVRVESNDYQDFYYYNTYFGSPKDNN